MEIYLDNSATTKPFAQVVEIMNKCLTDDYGNPSSMHTLGVVAEKYINNAKTIIAKTLKISEKEIVFTSGGTESNNMAIIGSAYAKVREGKHIITTKIEHPSVLNTMAFLEKQGYSLTFPQCNDQNQEINIATTVLTNLEPLFQFHPLSH